RQQQQEHNALAAFEKALVLNPHLADALAQIATMSMAKGEGQKALDRVHLQLRTSPNNPAIYYLLGPLSITLHKNDMADEATKRAIEANENFLLAYLNLGALYATQQ